MAAPSPIPADRVVRPDAATGFHLYILSLYEKPGWRARTSGDRLHTLHPGSAVSYEDTVYEVMAIEAAPGTGYTYRYALRKWEEQHVVRQIFPYTMETQRAEVAQIQEQRRQHRQHSWLIYLFPLTGLLPTPLLQRWEREWGLPMRAASFASVIFLAILGMTVGPYLLRHGPSPVALFFFYISIEQMLRFFWLLQTREAQGSFVATAAWGLWNVANGREPDGRPRRREAKDFAVERDEVRHLKEQPWDIEVRSLFRDPVLLGEEPVRFDNAVYQPLGCRQEGVGLQRRYVFRLKKLDEGPEAPRAARREYRPQRSAAEAAALIPYERTRDRVHAWALLCGYLPASRQLELEEKYEYDPAQNTERSALVMLLAAGFQLWYLFGTPARFGQLLALYLMVESVYRLALARSRGEPVGSAFGWVLSPLLKFR